MLVSWEWLSDYVELSVKPEFLAERFTMTGLNHESTTMIDGDSVLDLEVTSNRGDCLGHIGIAREASVLLNKPLKIPLVQIPKSQLASETMASTFSIRNDFVDGCSRYLGRLIHGVKVGSSPEWLKRRLKRIGVNTVNNVVDITNYVMFECGQPLHAFDLAKLRGNQIIIRPAQAGEKFLAIDHRTYDLTPSMVVIADVERAIALGGIMGGADSEVSAETVDLLIEAAAFTPLAIRRAARQLRLHSAASYRFERRVDPAGLFWAANRCCQLIAELCGGMVSPDAIETSGEPLANPPIILREAKIEKVLGISIPFEKSIDILRSLGCLVSPSSSTTFRSAQIVPPTFRSDLRGEIDLIEEIARIYGYDRIPENAVVPMAISSKGPKEILLDRVRTVALSSGLTEALTPSLVSKVANDSMSPWTTREALQTEVPLLEGTTYLRKTLIPSLLQAYQLNFHQQQRDAALFETANIYLPSEQPTTLPKEQLTLGWIAPWDARRQDGMIEELVSRIQGNCQAVLSKLDQSDLTTSYLTEQTGVWRYLNGEKLAWSGQLSRTATNAYKIDTNVWVGEINLELLLKHLELIPTLKPVVTYPSIQRDLNLIVRESLRWAELSAEVKRAAGEHLIECRYCETYRDPKRDGPGTKRVLLSLTLQSPDRTLTSDEVEASIQKVLRRTASQFDARLLH